MQRTHQPEARSRFPVVQNLCFDELMHYVYLNVWESGARGGPSHPTRLHPPALRQSQLTILVNDALEYAIFMQTSECDYTWDWKKMARRKTDDDKKAVIPSFLCVLSDLRPTGLHPTLTMLQSFYIVNKSGNFVVEKKNPRGSSRIVAPNSALITVQVS